jgi:hypothetical protein
MVSVAGVVAVELFSQRNVVAVPALPVSSFVASKEQEFPVISDWPDAAQAAGLTVEMPA